MHAHLNTQVILPASVFLELLDLHCPKRTAVKSLCCSPGVIFSSSVTFLVFLSGSQSELKNHCILLTGPQPGFKHSSIWFQNKRGDKESRHGPKTWSSLTSSISCHHFSFVLADGIVVQQILFSPNPITSLGLDARVALVDGAE